MAGGSGEEDAEVIQYRYGGGRNQTIYLESVGENEYKIVMRHSGKVLSPQKLSSENGAKLAQTTYNGSSNQKWKFIRLSNDEYQLINIGTGHVITADNDGYNITNNKIVYNNNQIWAINYAYDVVVPQISFNFDGENPGRLMGTDGSMEYTIDGGTTWKTISGTNMILSKEELDAVNVNNGIKVRVKGNAGIAVINIGNKSAAPNVTVNDNLNVVEGINSSMEYSIDNGANWTRYSQDNPPKFMNDVIVLVRIAGTGVTPPSDKKELRFTSKITIPLYKEFNPTDYIRTTDYSVQIINNTVDVNKKGFYSVEYKLIDDEGDETTITKEIEVVSRMDYLSDLNYKTGNAADGGVKKDTNLNSQVNEGLITLHSNMGKETFKKGITAHANSEVVYDVTDKGYTNFESYIGIDDTAYNTSASVMFKIYADGVLKYDSGVMNAKTPCQFIDLDINGVKEVKLVVDSNGSNNYDHSAWADAKFIAKDSAPLIEASNVAYEKEDTINFDEILTKVKATDVEDGDLSSKVTYTTNYRKGSTGNFDIVYNVTDSDGNKTEKTVKLIVVNSSIYVTDTEWKSARAGWGTIHKDSTINGTPLKVWDGAKEVTYEKGIGTHAYSETIYDLTGKDYGFFTSYVGASREGNGNTSVVFQVYVDGKLVEDTGVMRRDTAQKFIKVNIAGAKELKLVVTDAGNGQGNDVAIWGDAKFLIADKIIYGLDTSKLSEVITRAEALREADYEGESWRLLQEKLTIAKTILSNENVAQEEVDKACNDIIDAITNLKTYVYATDIEWIKAYTGWSSVKKDKSISDGVLTLWDGTKEVTYEKGIGTHAYSEVIYDLTGKNFKSFTSFIGVNRTANYRGLIQFKVFVDDKLAYTSNVMNKNTPLEFIKVNVEGANQIKLVVEDGGNGTGNDHANWADAKFIK